MTFPIPIAVRVRPKPSWTDERVELLKQLHPEGHSFGTLATMIGGVTRNAVIGKAKRLGLSMRGPSVVKPKPEGTPRLRIRLSTTHKRKPPTFPTEPISEPASAPTCERVTLMQLNDKTCRWPIGDTNSKDFGFCGAEPQCRLPYCPYHCGIAYQPSVRLSDDERARRRAEILKVSRVINPRVPPAAPEEYTLATKLADPPMSDEERAA